MPIRYSAATRGFYDTVLHVIIPEDAVPVTPRRHQELLEAQASGAVIVPGANGNPIIQRPADNVDVRRERVLRAIRREAARRIESVSPLWRQLNDMRGPSAQAGARFAAIDAIREASNEIEAQLPALSAAELASFDVTEHPLWPETAGLPRAAAEEEL